MRAVLLALAGLLWLVPAAGAAAYAVSACSGGNGTGTNRIFAPYGAADGCFAGPGLRSYQEAGATPPGAGFVMTAPRGTSIQGYAMSYHAEWVASVHGQWRSLIDDGAGGILSAPCTSAGCTPALPVTPYSFWGWSRVSRGGLDLPRLRLATACGLALCSDGLVRSWWRDIEVTLADPSPPEVQLERPASWISGTRPIAYSASDNSGIKGVTLEVDGDERGSRTEDCDHSYAVPCPDVSGAAFTVDTRDLADGAHVLELTAVDATGVNAGHATRSISVDNTPPTTRAHGQGNPASPQSGPVTVTLSARDAHSGMGASDPDEPVEAGGYVEYALDGGAVGKSRGDAVDVAVEGDGVHRLRYRARDVAGNAGPEKTVEVNLGRPEDGGGAAGALGFSARSLNPATTFRAAPGFGVNCPSQVTLSPSRTASVSQAEPDSAHTAPLTVRSAAGSNARVLLAFALPPAAGCTVRSAELSLRADRATAGRTVAAYRLASAWDGGVSWATRPGSGGQPATALAADTVELDLTGQVRDIYRFGDNGILVRDATEGSAPDAVQVYSRAELTVSFG